MFAQRGFLFWLALFSFSAMLLGPGCDCGDDDDDGAGLEDDDSAPDDDTGGDDDTTDDDIPPEVDDLIRLGKDWLAFPDGDRARLYFRSALDLAPDHPEAMYGLVLADTLHTTDVFSIIMDYLMSIIDYGGPIKEGKKSVPGLFPLENRKTWFSVSSEFHEIKNSMKFAAPSMARRQSEQKKSIRELFPLENSKSAGLKFSPNFMDKGNSMKFAAPFMARRQSEHKKSLRKLLLLENSKSVVLTFSPNFMDEGNSMKFAAPSMARRQSGEKKSTDGLFHHPIKSGLSGDDLINGILQRLLDGLLRDRAYELIDYARRSLDAGGVFQHEGIPIFIHYEQVAELATEFDEGELHATTAFAGLFSALFLHLYALDLDFDIFNFYRFAVVDFDAMSPEEIAAMVVEVLLDILTDPAFPDFLTLPEGNADTFRQAGLEMGDGLDAWTRVFPAINLETDDQSDDVMGYVDRNENGVYDPGEPYFLPHYGELDEDAMEYLEISNALVAGLRDSFYDYTEKDVDPERPNPFPLALLRPLLVKFGIPGFLVPNWKIDIGAWYQDPAGSGFKETLITILEIVDAFLP